MAAREVSLKHRLENLAARAVLRTALILPYKTRVATVGALFSYVIAPLVGWSRRVHDNLALVAPDMPAREAKAITRAVTNNMGRSLIEVKTARWRY